MSLFIRILFRNVTTHSRCVFVFWVECHFVSGEPDYDNDHAGTGET